MAIRDESPGDAVGFEAAGTVEGADGEVVHVMMSDTPLPFLERNERRPHLYHLTEEDPSGRIPIARLPLPSPESMKFVTVEGRQVAVAEVFVYL